MGFRLKLLALAVALAAVGFGVWYFAFRTPEPRDDFGRFQGAWQLGVPAVGRDKQPAARFTAATVAVLGDKWVFRVGGQEQKRYAAVLRPQADPKEIDLTQLGPDDKPVMLPRNGKPAPVVLRGVYLIEGDHAKVVFAPDPDPRPTAVSIDIDPPIDSARPVSVWLLERLK